jgi:NAD(P)-dependent dehydrogenase (short-subunit alcohol dehydrogenase family)
MNKQRFRDLFDMSGRVVVVTGGTRGIGRTLAEGYVHAGAKVVVASRNPEACKETEEHLRAIGGEALGVPADVGDLEDVSRIVMSTIEQFGRLDVLVNNAALGGQHTVGSFSPEEWEQMFHVNVRGPVFLLHAALPYLKESEHAAVLNILSAAGFLNSRWFPIYGPSKAALFGHTRAAAAELAQYGIRVNAIAPGPFATDILLSEPPEIHQYTAQITLLNRIADTDEMVGTALLLTSDAGSFITGQVLMVDGGMVVAR